MRLDVAYIELRNALAPLGIEIGRDVLALWRDRERHHCEPLPADALKHLTELATRLLAQEPP